MNAKVVNRVHSHDFSYFCKGGEDNFRDFMFAALGEEVLQKVSLYLKAGCKFFPLSGEPHLEGKEKENG